MILDIGTSITTADSGWLREAAPHAVAHKLTTPIWLNGIAGGHTSDTYVDIDLWLPCRAQDGSPVWATVRREIHLVDHLEPRLLVGMDIIAAEGMVVDTEAQTATLPYCQNATFETATKRRAPEPFSPRDVRAATRTTVPAHTQVAVPVCFGSPLPIDGGDFSFDSRLDGSPVRGYHHVTDSNFDCVLVRNDSDQTQTIDAYAKVGRLTEWECAGGYAIDPQDHGMAALRPSDTMVDPHLETVHHTGVTVYGDPDAYRRFANVIEDFPLLFTDRATVVDVPAADHMPIPLRHDWQDKLPPPKIYPAGARDREVIDKAFDPLQAAGKLEFTKHPTPFSFPVFVVWKKVVEPKSGEEVDKPRAVVDIRGLNKIAVPDSYQVPLQADLFANLRGARFISTMDALSFFYQWLIAADDRHKMTVNTHRGQETFNVAVMGYCNSVQYVQRQLDGILRDCRTFARAYIDDIVIWSETLEDHEEFLRRVMALLDGRRISISPKKTYIGFPSATLLGQRVSGLGLAANEDRVKAVLAIQFPQTLKSLETYIGMTNYLRTSIPYYAQLSAPLQQVKTALLKSAPSTAGNARKAYVRKAVLDLKDPKLRDAFEAIQDSFRSLHFLHHFDHTRQLYCDIDSSREYGHGCMIYMVKGDPEPIMDGNRAKLFPKTDIEPIMFLSCALTPAEQRYWPTELEVAGVVWMVKKTHHFLHACKAPTIIFTDHAAAVGLSNQTSLVTTTCTDKLNLKLVRASAYLSQFRLRVIYRPGKIHFVPDALSRLQGAPNDRPPHEETLDPHAYHGAPAAEATKPRAGHGLCEPRTCHGSNDLGWVEADSYHTILVELSTDFKERLTKAYADDPHWARIMDLILKSQARREIDTASSTAMVRYRDGLDPLDGDEYNSPLGLRFFERHGLLYFRDFESGRDRLCIPTAMEKEAFEHAHDDHHHQGFDRCYDRLRSSVYVHRLKRRLTRYIAHCKPCQYNQTKRHQPHGELKPIQHEVVPFQTVTMDWIVAMPETRAPFSYNALLTTTCKATKKVCLTPGRDTWSAQEWADAWVRDLEIRDWSYPLRLVSDRDPKFLSGFFKGMAKALKIKMLTSSAYHPQTDGQSERTNQTVEIGLRYFLTSNPGEDFTDCLPSLQATLNNSRNSTTGYAPNEILTGFKSNLDGLHALSDLPPADFEKLRVVIRHEVEDAVAWANAAMKARYDSGHKPVHFKDGDSVMLRLHHGYKMLGQGNRKFSHQREGPFKIKRRIGELAYELDLPPNYTIHPVVSIAQLEPIPQEPDPFDRPQNHEPGPVAAEDDEAPAYEIERLIGRQVKTKHGRPVVQYLVKWVGYSAAANQWYDLEDLGDALDLVKAYDDSHEGDVVTPLAAADRAPRSVMREPPRRAGLRSGGRVES